MHRIGIFCGFLLGTPVSSTIKIEQILMSLILGVQREDLDQEMKESGQKKSEMKKNMTVI
jgi:hypothetical protein